MLILQKYATVINICAPKNRTPKYVKSVLRIEVRDKQFVTKDQRCQHSTPRNGRTARSVEAWSSTRRDGHTARSVEAWSSTRRNGRAARSVEAWSPRIRCSCSEEPSGTPSRVKHRITARPSSSTPRYTAKRNENTCLYENLPMDFHSGVIHHNQTAETTQMFTT